MKGRTKTMRTRMKTKRKTAEGRRGCWMGEGLLPARAESDERWWFEGRVRCC